MVHVIVFDENSPGVVAATEHLQVMANGWIEMRSRVWLVGGDLNAAEWRDELEQFGARVCVASLNGGWATQGMPQIANWLRGARGTF